MRPKLRTWGLLIGAAILLSGTLIGLDLLVDPEPSTSGEIAVDFAEKMILVGAMMVASRLVFRVGLIEQETRHIKQDLHHARNEGEKWRSQSRQLLAGLATAIQSQFNEWDLTPAESDIAGLMLKGLSLKDISGLRQTSEATIRQQAQGIYRKSGLANRAQLSAYFLEDLYDVAGGDETSEQPRAIN